MFFILTGGTIDSYYDTDKCTAIPLLTDRSLKIILKRQSKETAIKISLYKSV